MITACKTYQTTFQTKFDNKKVHVQLNFSKNLNTCVVLLKHELSNIQYPMNDHFTVMAINNIKHDTEIILQYIFVRLFFDIGKRRAAGGIIIYTRGYDITVTTRAVRFSRRRRPVIWRRLTRLLMCIHHLMMR